MERVFTGAPFWVLVRLGPVARLAHDTEDKETAERSASAVYFMVVGLVFGVGWAGIYPASVGDTPLPCAPLQIHELFFTLSSSKKKTSARFDRASYPRSCHLPPASSSFWGINSIFSRQLLMI